MNNHPIESLMRSTMENIRNMIDVNTIIGDAITAPDGSVMIPISKVSFGFASAGSEFTTKASENSQLPFGGGCGAGVSVKPVAFLVVKNDTIRLLSVDHDNSLDRVIDSIPQFIDLFKSKTKNESTSSSKNFTHESSTSDAI